MTEIMLVTRVPCDFEYIDRINSLKVSYVIGLGDIECPMHIRNYYGIVGEMENLHVIKYLKLSNRLIVKRFLKISADKEEASTYYISHLYNVSLSIAGFKQAFFGHNDYPVILNSKVWIIGSFSKGYYVLIDLEKEKAFLQNCCH